ncbi:MAG: hydrogenase formation protein HypD [Candidatus Heimdallarchaeaceae archaeon]
MTDPTKNYRSKEAVKTLIKKINEEAEKIEGKVRIMHVCGTHEHDIVKAGLRALIPKKVELIAGPGCPVCVCSSLDIDEVLWVADHHDAIITTFGDMMRVPSSFESLYQAQGRGLDVRVVYSISDAIAIARKNPNRDVLFFSVGFETTSCITASEVLRVNLPNFSIYSSHKVIPPAMELLLQRDDIEFQGYLAPGHVSTIIGVHPYEFIPEKYHFPVAIGGFEPTDILLAIHSLLKQIRTDDPIVDNVYKRYVKEEGNVAAIQAMEEAFVISDARWRGLGVLPGTGYEISDDYAHIDAKKKYDIPELETKDLHQGCRCDEILIGKIKPQECKLFMKACRPDHPVGACMVSHEGTCNVAATYEGFDSLE